MFKTTPPANEAVALVQLLEEAKISAETRAKMQARAVELVNRIRKDSAPGMMELFLGEYGLSSEEGIALMCLAEALLRVPDAATIDALIEDKIAPSAWGQHLGKSHSPLVNASTWALFVTGKVLSDSEDDTIASVLHGAIKRLGEPIIRQAVSQAMKEMGRQFVLGETIEKAIERARGKEAEGFTYSYDMLGEAARTEQDAKRYHLSYSEAISALAKCASGRDIRDNPGISIKLSALHPRYETLQRNRVMDELVPRARSLAVLAKSAGIGLNIDAEEAGRLELSLGVIEAILCDPAFENWEGFGVVVQAYGLKAPLVIDWLYELACKLDRRIMVRLVKGAYWDSEIKLSQVEGHDGFPVFTRKPSTDVSYICCAQKLLAMADRIYPQFATHNAHTIAAILELAGDKSGFEFQRLHGMGEALHDSVLKQHKTRCRIYAPVGAHKDLLAYLVRRLLENGANSSFVNQIVDETVPPKEVAADPFEAVETYLDAPLNPVIRQPEDLFRPERKNSFGWDLNDPATLERLEAGIAAFDTKTWQAKTGSLKPIDVLSPATGKLVGSVQFASVKDVKIACSTITPWHDASAQERAETLEKIADLYEANSYEMFSLLMQEAGKTLLDCVGELREAVDFLRYYAQQVKETKGSPVGVFTCISPWNFPLAIFTGQVAAALAAGNGVLAKPAEATSLIANFAVNLMWQAGVPKAVLFLLPGTGAIVGNALTNLSVVDGVCFTGSTATARLINQGMAKNLSPCAPLIAETGGINAMIVDSTALPEQAVGDVVASAFQSAGQRCSALRILYLQKDIADGFLEMLYGAIDALIVGDSRDFVTDIGPIIDMAAAKKIQVYIEKADKNGRLLKQGHAPKSRIFVPPTVIGVNTIDDIEEEIFGPVLHVALFDADKLDNIIDGVNAKGYGLTFGLQSRIDDRVQHIIDRIDAGNIYINRNQIGAIVGSQPFGGEGLSGTGPKAGGPRYLKRFLADELALTKANQREVAVVEPVNLHAIEDAFEALERHKEVGSNAIEMPGPTGESNRYSTVPKGRVLCLGPSKGAALAQLKMAKELGCHALAIAPGLSNQRDQIGGRVGKDALEHIALLDAVVSWHEDAAVLQEFRLALAARKGPIVPLLCGQNFVQWLVNERHVCVDTTAAGGNAALLGA